MAKLSEMTVLINIHLGENQIEYYSIGVLIFLISTVPPADTFPLLATVPQERAAGTQNTSLEDKSIFPSQSIHWLHSFSQ